MKRLLLSLIGLIAFTTVLNAQWGVVYKKDLPVMLTPRMTSQIVTSFNNKIIAMGGHTSGFALLNTAVAIDDTGSVWSYFNLADNRDNSGIVYLKDSTALLIGGMSSALGVGQLATTDRVYPHLLLSVAGPNMVHARTMANGIQLNDGKVLVAGCWYSDGAATQAELINLATNQSTATGNLNQPRAYPTLVATNDGNALLFGGWGIYGGEFSGKVEEYNYQTGQFTVIRDQLFTDDPDFRVVTDFGDDMQHKTLPDGKKLFLARKFQNGTGWRLFTVDPATKAFEVIPLYLPVADTLTGKIFTYLPPIIYGDPNPWQILIPQLWTDDQGLHHIELIYGSTTLPSTFYKAASTATSTWWPYYAARAPYKNSNFESAIIFIGGNQTSNFDPVADAFVLVLNDFADVNDPDGTPSEFTLEQNYPNPFNPETVVRFALPVAGFTELKVYNSVGELVKVLVNEEMSAGRHEVKFDASNLPSGVYMYRISTGNYSAARKMLLIK